MKSTATVTRYIGKCPICEGDFKLTTDKKMVHHGYERPGDGVIHGDCIAVGAPAYEESCEITKEYSAQLGATKAMREARVESLIAGHVSELTYQEHPRANLQTVRKGDPTWDRVLREVIAAIESNIRGLSKTIARLGRLVDAWVARPLRTVDEFEGPRQAERTAKKDQKAADKAAKLAEVIARYQERIDGAVTRKKPSILAGIFESAPRKLRDMTMCTERQAYAMLERDAVFQAFGLDLDKGYSYNGPNGTILANMQSTSWDKETAKAFPWPVALTRAQ